MATQVEVIKNKLVLEDIQVGTGYVTQTRGGEEVQALEVNAAQLQGILVVDAVTKLEELTPEILLSRTVFVKENHTIYTWDEVNTQWTQGYSNIYIVSTEAELTTIPEGYVCAFVTSNGQIYIKQNDTWTISFSGLYVLDSTTKLSSVPNGINSVIIQSTGALYYRDGVSWIQVQISDIGDPIQVVSTVDELSSIDSNQIQIAIVSDTNRGGLFIYLESNKEIDDSGIIFNGWTRQYTGLQSLYWYGVVGDGETDDSQAFQKYLNNNTIINLENTTYKLSKPLTLTKSAQIIGNNAILQLTDSSTIGFTGSIDTSIEVQGSINPGENNLLTNNVSNYTLGQLVLVKSRDTYYSSYITDAQKLYSFFSYISNVNGNTLILTQGSKVYFSTAVCQRINSLNIKISDVTIEVDGARQTPVLSFDYCSDVIIDNLKISAEVEYPLVQFTKCFNVLVNNSSVMSNGTNAVAVKIIDSDNIVLKTNNIYGTNVGIELANEEMMSNSIGIFESIVSSSNVKDNYSIKCGDGLSGLNVMNSQLTGDILLQGGNFKFENSIISLPYRITPQYLQGGTILFDHCVFYATGTDIVTCLYGNSELNVVTEDLFHVSSNISFIITNNTFVLTSQYTSLFELVAVPAGTSISQIKHSVTYSNNKLQGSYDECIELQMYGPFNKVTCDFFQAEKLTRLGKGISVFTIGAAITEHISSLGLTWKNATFESFMCNSIYPANAPTSEDPLTQNTMQQMCFKDAYLTTNAGNVIVVHNAGVWYGDNSTLTYYAVQTRAANSSGNYALATAPTMPSKPSTGYA